MTGVEHVAPSGVVCSNLREWASGSVTWWDSSWYCSKL